MDKEYIRSYIKDNIESVIKILDLAVDESLAKAPSEFPQYISRLECNKAAITKQIEMINEIEKKLDNDPHNIFQSIKLIENLCDFVHQDMNEMINEMCGNEAETKQVVH